ncbi:unnamed protein product [Protopolystoma xenopodis]|uniref:Uncharacterized protein n=1 Tax=Protopolystoma xenopodis TaxID=117903 RepID=A0A3S5AAZ7_9PLAT|nr:unnamed protein product [Protopolystoma xenopodis]
MLCPFLSTCSPSEEVLEELEACSLVLEAGQLDLMIQSGSGDSFSSPNQPQISIRLTRVRAPHVKRMLLFVPLFIYV